MKSKIYITVCLIVIVILLCFGVFSITSGDKKAPEITVSQNTITYHQGEGRSVLLEGVTAIDDKDGDVSSYVMVESVIVMENGNSARVKYVAKDKHNNVARADRIVNYVGDGSNVTNSDESDDNTAGEGETQTGQQSETETASNSAEETQTQPATDSQSPDKPVLTLSQSEVTIKKGDSFNPVSYVSDITDDKDSTDNLYRRIIVDGEKNTSVAGDYTLTIYCSDTDGNYSNKSTLKLKVTE